MASALNLSQLARLHTVMELELGAAFVTVRAHVAAHPTLTNIVPRVDTVAACFALVKGRARSPLLGKIVTAYRTFPNQGRAGVRVAYINADPSPADVWPAAG